jgi:hypothetical protein
VQAQVTKIVKHRKPSLIEYLVIPLSLKKLLVAPFVADRHSGFKALSVSGNGRTQGCFFVSASSVGFRNPLSHDASCFASLTDTARCPPKER